MRVLVYTAWAPPARAGGGLSAFRFARYLARTGHEVTQLTLNQDLQFPKEEWLDGVHIVRAPYLRDSRLAKAFSLALVLPDCVDQLRRADVVILYGPVPAYSAMILLGRATGRRVIYRSTMMRDNDPDTLIRRDIAPRLRKAILGRVHTYYAMHPEFTASWKRAFGDTRQVVQTAQGVDTSIFKPATDRDALRDRLGLDRDATLILAIGWVIPRKGYDGLFEAAGELEEDFQLLVIGEYEPNPNHPSWNERHEMNALTDKGRRLLGDRLTFTGSLDNVDAYLAAADIFVLNSSQEGLPNVVLEAMSSGLATLTKRLEGVDGYLTIDGETAIVFDTTDELQQALSRMLRHPEERRALGDRAATFIRDTFSYEAVAARLFG
jgi:glycosyltransferase involved in cell wall biosynthesis